MQLPPKTAFELRAEPAHFPVTVSILMPILNAQDTLVRAVGSVQRQTFQNWELILIDDGSQDQSRAMCQAWDQNNIRIRMVRLTKTQGAARARNHGLAAARGRYIAFLDADDEWLPEKLSRQINHMRRGGHAFSYTGYWKVQGQHQRYLSVPQRISRAQLLKGNVIGCLTAMYDRAHFGSVPMPNLPMRHDFALWLELLKKTNSAAGLCEPLAIHHRRSGSLSSSNVAATRALWRLYRHHLAYSRWVSAYFLTRQIASRLWRG